MKARAVTRGQAVKCLLDCAGYGPAARLQGIYTCTYSDAAAIPEADLGYAAIAQALGMVREAIRGTGQPPGASWPPYALPPAGAAGEQTRAPERARRMMEFGRNYT